MKLNHYKTCWISDTHLASSSCESVILYNFLKNNSFDTLYLNGDIIDIWRMQKSGIITGPQAQTHINIIQMLLKLSKKGTKIIYILGNHDDFLENFVDNGDWIFGNINIVRECVHETADGRKFLVVHGHQLDFVTRCNPWLSKLGDTGYHLMIFINRIYNKITHRLGFKYWSLSKYIKIKVKKAVNFIGSFEENAIKMIENSDCVGIIVGHIHNPEIKNIESKIYMNSGCWTDKTNCNALIERIDGSIDLIRWTEDNKEEVLIYGKNI